MLQFKFIVIVLMVGAFSVAPGVAQECGLTLCGEPRDPVLEVTGCGTSCQVGETITFTTVAQRNGVDEGCLNDPNNPGRDECCTEDCANEVIPFGVYYEGYKLVGSQWVKDADCINGPNPLSHTFSAGEEGTYRRQTCVDAGCADCSAEVTVTVQ